MVEQVNHPFILNHLIPMRLELVQIQFIKFMCYINIICYYVIIMAWIRVTSQQLEVILLKTTHCNAKIMKSKHKIQK